MSQAAEPKRLAKPVDWDELYPGRFLKASDLKGQRVTVTIKSVDLEELEGDGGKIVKGVIGFAGKEKMMALNRTNGLCLRSMFGKKVQAWEGKRVTLIPTETKFGAETVDAIRIYGSPDIPRDIEIELKLPKKRPIKMTMHRTEGRGSAPAQPPTATKSEPKSERSPVEWTSQLNAADTLQKLEATWSDVVTSHGDRPPPLELDAAYQNRREQLGEQEGRQLDL
jgi:hypothetical protein